MGFFAPLRGDLMTTHVIAERRRRLGLSQPVLATLAAVPMMALSRAERGIGRALRPDELARLDRVLSAIEHVRAECAGLPLSAA
jgi:DNA-binding transcriptional regulator YiaG